MATKSGSSKAGPSKFYVRLLQGKIDSKKYADTLKRDNARPKSA